MNRLTGIHAVREALEAARPIDTLIVAKGSHGNRIEELVRLARKNGVPVRFEERVRLDRTAGTHEHQGVVALVAASPSASFLRTCSNRARRGCSACWSFSTASKTRRILALSCAHRLPPARKAW